MASPGSSSDALLAEISAKLTTIIAQLEAVKAMLVKISRKELVE